MPCIVCIRIFRIDEYPRVTAFDVLTLRVRMPHALWQYLELNPGISCSESRYRNHLYPHAHSFMNIGVGVSKNFTLHPVYNLCLLSTCHDASLAWLGVLNVMFVYYGKQ